LQSTLVTVSGNIAALNNVSITEIIASGNAANWSGVTPVTDLTTINTKLDTISGYTDSLESDIASITGATVTGVFDETISGSLNFRTAITEAWSFSANDVDVSAVSSGILHTYKDPTGADSFTLLATPSGRFRS
jgi:hypothetical protein